MAGLDLTGHRYGRLVCLTLEKRVEKRSYWRCRCDCGAEKAVLLGMLRCGGVKSCGCLRRETSSNRRRTHGQSANANGGRARPLYTVWNTMRRRCNLPMDRGYPRYGGRGISVCSEWERYDTFQKWASANGYRPGLSIDRIDNDGNYEPENCRWVGPKEQARNKSGNVVVTHNGLTACLAEHAERHPELRYCTLRRRIRDGWSVERAFETPLKSGGKSCATQ